MNKKLHKKTARKSKTVRKTRRPRRVDPTLTAAKAISRDTTDALIDQSVAATISGKSRDHGLHFEISTLVAEKRTPIRVAPIAGDVPTDPAQANSALEEVLALGTLCYYEGPPDLERTMRPEEPAGDAENRTDAHECDGACGHAARAEHMIPPRRWVIRLDPEHGAGFVQLHQEIGEQIFCTATMGGDAAEFLTHLQSLMRRLFPLHPPEVLRSQMRRKIMLVTEQQGSLVPTPLGRFDVPLNRDNYAPHALECFDRVAAELQSNCPTGRLVVIDGPPGTGKTYFIRGLLEAVADCIFLLLPPRLVRDLDGPMLQSFLLGLRVFDGPVVLILEDAEQAITERGPDNQSMLATLLQATDGLLADVLDLRVIATTNIDLRKEKIDGAVARDGRLLAHVTIEHRSRDELQEIFRRLVARDDATLPEGVTSLASTYRAAREAGWTPPVVKRVASEGVYPEMLPHGTRYAPAPLYPRSPLGYGA